MSNSELPEKGEYPKYAFGKGWSLVRQLEKAYGRLTAWSFDMTIMQALSAHQQLLELFNEYPKLEAYFNASLAKQRPMHGKDTIRELVAGLESQYEHTLESVQKSANHRHIEVPGLKEKLRKHMEAYG